MQNKNVFSDFEIFLEIIAKLKNLITIMICLCFSYQLLFPIIIDNFTVIEKQTLSVAQSIASKVTASHNKVFHIKMNEHSAAVYTDQLITSELSKHNLLSTDSSNFTLDCKIIHNNVYYNKLSHRSDSVSRIVKTELIYSLIKSGINLTHNTELIAYTDTVAIGEIEWLERSELPFAKSPLPPQENSWISELITPAIVLGASILSVVLLFSVRSK